MLAIAATSAALVIVAAVVIYVRSQAVTATSSPAATHVAGTEPSTATPVLTAPPSSAPPTSAPETSPSPSGRGLHDVAMTDPAAAARQLAERKVTVAGTPVQAWRWVDDSGRNVLVLSRSIEHQSGAHATAATLHVVHVRLDLLKPVVRQLRDAGVNPCDVDFDSGFTASSVTIGDRDGDGLAEATVGWWTSCRGDPGPYAVKLALLTDGRLYILRGTGQLAADPALPASYGVPPASFTAQPGLARWPTDTFAATVRLFHTIYR